VDKGLALLPVLIILFTIAINVFSVGAENRTTHFDMVVIKITDFEIKHPDCLVWNFVSWGFDVTIWNFGRETEGVTLIVQMLTDAKELWNSSQTFDVGAQEQTKVNGQAFSGMTAYFAYVNNSAIYRVTIKLSDVVLDEWISGGDSQMKIVGASPQNKTYFVNEVLLDFTVNKPVSWVGYSLNGQDKITVSGNSTISRLPNGSQDLVLYAIDSSGNTAASETIHFSVDAPTPFAPLSVLIISFTAIVAVSVGLLYYDKKASKSTSAQTQQSTSTTQGTNKKS
jgi:hypothetical protein